MGWKDVWDFLVAVWTFLSPPWREVAFGVIGIGIGIKIGLIINWYRAQELKRQSEKDEKRKLIQQWKNSLNSISGQSNFKNIANFLHSSERSQMSVHFKKEIIEKFEQSFNDDWCKNNMIFDISPLRDEITRLEKEWELI